MIKAKAMIIEENYLKIHLVNEIKSDNIKFLIINRNTNKKQRIKCEHKNEHLFLDLSEVKIYNKDILLQRKDILDLFIEVNGKVERIEVENKYYKERYIDSYFSLDKDYLLTPYLTLKREISILCGKIIDVLTTICNIKDFTININDVIIEDNKVQIIFNENDIIKYGDLIALCNYENDNINEFPVKNRVRLKDGLAKVTLYLKKNKKITQNEKLNLKFLLKNNKEIINLKFISRDDSKKVIYNECVTTENIIVFNQENKLQVGVYDPIEFYNETSIIKRKNIFIDKIVRDDQSIVFNLNKNQLDNINYSDISVALLEVKEKKVVSFKTDNISIKKSSITMDISGFDEKYLRKGVIYRPYILIKDKSCIYMCQLIKQGEIQEAKYRYLKPVKIHEKEIIPYINVKKEFSIVMGNHDDYNKAVYKLINKKRVIKDVSVENDKLKFKSYLGIDKDIIDFINIIIRNRQSNESVRIPVNFIDNNEYEVDLVNFADKYGSEVSRWNFFIEIAYDKFIEISRIGYFDSEVLPAYKRFFDNIPRKNMITPYLTIKNELSIVIKPLIALQMEKLKVNTALSKFNMNKNILKLGVDVSVDNIKEIEIKEVLLKYRSNVEDKQIRIPIKTLKNKNNTISVYFEIDLDLYSLDYSYWDIFMIVVIDNEEFYGKIKNIKKYIKTKIDKRVITYSYNKEENNIIYPYVTVDGAVAICSREKGKYEKNKYKFKELLACSIAALVKPYFNKKDLWLVYEKFSEGAQDNGFYFFKHCYENHKERNIYYIIQKESPDYKNLYGMEDRVLEFMSFKYMIYLYSAKLLISSESKPHCYAWRVQKGILKEALNRKTHVFLQHGVIALKKIDYIFKKTKSNSVDLFVVSSDYEKNIINKSFGYKEHEILNVGLCRWDVMENKEGEKKEILLMPTWRSWMDDIEEEKFIESDYYKNYKELLNSKELLELLDNNDLILNFYIHPKFKAYVQMFRVSSDRVKVYEFGEVQLNELMMKSSMLITDYSSVSWDMYYQGKPILFYQFDLEEYNIHQGSYLDMENELFGDRSSTIDELLSDIEYYVNRSFVEKKEYKEMRKKYFKYVDKNNCERTYDSILKKKDYLDRKTKMNEKSLYNNLKKRKTLRRIYKKLNLSSGIKFRIR